jgi:prolipoprotein diacylglyceryltransferase
MYPLIFGGYSTYAFAIAAIAPLPIIFLIRALWREGVQPGSALVALLLLLSSALVGGKLFSLASRGWPEQLSLSYELAGGMRFSGVVIGVLLMLPLVQRWYLRAISLARSADILAKTLVLTVCAARVACLLTGCCTGGTGETLLHLSYPPGSNIWYQHLQSGVIENSQLWSEPVLALPILFFLASLAAAVFLFKFDLHRRYDGQVFLLFLLVHELPKSLLELLREPLIPEQLMATVVAGVVGLLGLLYLRSHHTDF